MEGGIPMHCKSTEMVRTPGIGGKQCVCVCVCVCCERAEAYTVVTTLMLT